MSGALSALSGQQSALAPHAFESGRILTLFDLFFWTTLVIYLGVMLFLLGGVIRGRRNRTSGEGMSGVPPPPAESGWRIGLTSFAGFTALVLFILSLATWFTDRSIASASTPRPLEVEVTGHQWWWHVRYKDPVPKQMVVTANELVIPAGRTVHVSLTTADVIHSLWIPNLAGKQDLIPGRKSDVSIIAKPGEYRAQCAEFCGMQHAQMALTVSVKPPADFAKWYLAQQQKPPVPTSGPALAGYVLFQNKQCSSCHAIAGTPASGQVAPDLTHVASRKTIAAGSLPNTPETMRGWIADPQKVKPGNAMPKVPLTAPELDAVVAYLETLK